MDEIGFVERVLREASALVRERYGDRASLEVSEKGGAADLVTAADVAVQRLVQREIMGACPCDALMAEEAGQAARPKRTGAERCWVLDPIDGTHNFARGLMPAYGVSLALAVGGEPAAGGVVFPGLRDEDLYLAQRGAGAMRNGRRLRVSAVADLERARVEVDLSRLPKRGRSLGAFGALLRSAGQVRCHGCAVVSMCAVAGGEAEGFAHPGPAPWDIAAGLLLVREAGGRVTRPDGREVGVFDEQSVVVASNGRLHETLLGLIAPEVVETAEEDG